MARSRQGVPAGRAAQPLRLGDAVRAAARGGSPARGHHPRDEQVPRGRNRRAPHAQPASRGHLALPRHPHHLPGAAAAGHRAPARRPRTGADDEPRAIDAPDEPAAPRPPARPRRRTPRPRALRPRPEHPAARHPQRAGRPRPRPAQRCRPHTTRCQRPPAPRRAPRHPRLPLARAPPHRRSRQHPMARHPAGQGGGRRRQALLEAHGQRVIRVTWQQATAHAAQTAQRVTLALAGPGAEEPADNSSSRAERTTGTT